MLVNLKKKVFWKGPSSDLKINQFSCSGANDSTYYISTTCQIHIIDFTNKEIDTTYNLSYIGSSQIV